MKLQTQWLAFITLVLPLFGLAAATKHVPAEGGLSAAKGRMSGG